MTKLRASFNGAREVLTLVALLASLPMLAEAGAITGPASVAPNAVLTEAGAATCFANTAALIMLAEGGAITDPAISSLLPMLTEVGAAAGLA